MKALAWLLGSFFAYLLIQGKADEFISFAVNSKETVKRDETKPYGSTGSWGESLSYNSPSMDIFNIFSGEELTVA